MINSIDLVLGILIVIYLLKNFGGLIKTLKNVVVILLFLFIYAICSRLFLNLPVPDGMRKTFGDSQVTNFSVLLVKWFYPAIEKTVPQLNTFVKDRILSTPTPEVDVSEIEKALPQRLLPHKALPKLSIPETLKLD